MNNKNKNILISMVLLILSYGFVNAWTNLSSVTTGDSLTATVWNDMATKLNDAWQRASGIFTDGSGNVGVGTENPNSKLHVNWAITLWSHVITKWSNWALVLNAWPADWLNQAGVWFRKNNILWDVSSYIDLMRITETWNVWIWTISPWAKLQVSWWETILQQESWITPTLQNSWVDYWVTYAPAWYFKDSMWIVHIRWLVKNGTIWTCVFTLPAWYRPTYRMLYSHISNSAISRVDIETNWCIIAYSWSNVWYWLDWITFATH